MTDTCALHDFLARLAIEDRPGMFNPWCQLDDHDIAQQPAVERIDRLRLHLLCNAPRLVLIGEAPGYQGCRYSGVAFTSERLIFEGTIPRLEHLAGIRITTRHRPWSEPSATIIWKALYEHGLAEDTVMFNAVPWHPVGKNGPHSNRKPTEAERAAGLPHLRRFLNLFPGMPVAACGNTALASLTELGVEHTRLRHPANGGAPKFRAGIAALCAPTTQGDHP